MARPTKLTPERQEKICENIRLGMIYKRAALAAGISPSTFYSWKARGEEETSSEYSEFLETLKKAEAEGEARHLTLIEDAAKGGGQSTETREVFKKGELVERITVSKPITPQWQAAAWLLERRYPNRWARYSKIEVHDWRTEIAELVKEGSLSVEQVKEELGDSLAQELFEFAGLATVAGRAIEKN